MSDPVSSSTGVVPMDDTDWKRLHGRVLPNQLSLDEFKLHTTDGTLHDQYRANDLHKIAQEMRDILREHGELREAACFPVKGKKGELGRAMAAAIRVLSRGTSDGSPSDTFTEGTHPTAPLSRRHHATDAVNDSLNDTIAPSVSPEDTYLPNTTSHSHTPSARASERHVPITDHIETVMSPALSSSSTVPERTHASTVTTTAAVVPPAPGSDTATRLSLRIARNASLPHASPLERSSEPTAGQHTTAKPVEQDDARVKDQTSTVSPSTASAFATTENKPIGVVNELNALNENGSPFFQILNVIRRFQVRYGTHQLRFDIPVQYAQAVAARRLRVLIIPLKHPNLPAKWPTAKEVVVFVNDQCVTIPWKRNWPERKEEVTKSFLPLDVTQMLLSRSGASTTQRLQVDVFTNEYFAPALLVVAHPFTLEEVVEQTLYDATANTDVATVEAHLLSLLRSYEASGASTFNSARQTTAQSGTPSQAQVKLAASMNDTIRLYRGIMEDDVDDGIEADDPIITTKCPISQLPLHIPIRGVHCRHLQCVDLASYLMSCSKGCYWNCALCDAPLRPRDVRIDTVLWSFLCHFRTQSDALPHYLRLSVRGNPTADAVPTHQYYWHVSRPHGAEADVLVTSSDDEAGEREPRPELHADAPPPAVVGQKRCRTPSPATPTAPTEGTLDNPIEL